MRIHRIGQTKNVAIKRFIVKVHLISYFWKLSSYLVVGFFFFPAFKYLSDSAINMLFGVFDVYCQMM